jgi:hypothetical protein
LKPILLQKDSVNFFCFDNRQITFIRKELELKNLFSDKIDSQFEQIKNLQERNTTLETQFGLYQQIEKNKNTEIELKDRNLEIKNFQIKVLEKKIKRNKKIMFGIISVMTSVLVYKSIK